tara:strand:- start:422 stop:718 length:297 start_codon:yes stop_codon:yes gene_type:complete
MITVNGVVKWKTGEITSSILDYVEFLGEATFTEMNRFYHQDIHEYKEYDPVKNRGGSFCHHLKSLKEPRKRVFDGRYRWLVKKDNGKWAVKEVHKMFL